MSETSTLRRAAPLWLQIGMSVLAAYLIATAVAGLLLAQRLSSLGEAAAERELESHLTLLAPTVLRGLATDDLGVLREITERSRRIANVRVTVIRPDGEVVAESEHALPMPSHRERPEIAAALQSGRGRSRRLSSTVGERFLYLAERLDDPGGEPRGVLRVSLPLASVETSAHELWQTIVLALLLGVPVAALVGWLSARRIARPLEDMTNAAARMAAGDFGELPHGTRDDEAGRLAEALRKMGIEVGSTLAQSEADRAEVDAILGSMVEGVLAVDRDLSIVRANRSVARCLEQSEAPRPGTPLADVADFAGLSEQASAALAGEPIADADVHLPGPAARVVNVSAAPIDGPDGQIVGAIVVLRDVTPLRRLERARLDFVANVSHELRTPIAAVLAALETVQSLPAEAAEDRERMLESAGRNAARLSAIVHDLLALSRIEAEEEHMERTAQPLLRAVGAALATLAAEAERRGVELVGPGRDARDVVVLGHAGRLEEVWANLVENAVKYTPRGGTVRVETSVDQGAAEACVSIADTGPGIAADALPRIFERFYRVDTSRSRAQGGTGLGLAIVKHIVRAHRGRVEVESELGRGSMFRVILPLANAQTDGAPGVSANL